MSKLFAFNASNSITPVIADGAYDSAHQVWIGTNDPIACRSIEAGQGLGTDCKDAYDNARSDCGRKCKRGESASGHTEAGCWTWWGGTYTAEVFCNCGC